MHSDTPTSWKRLFSRALGSDSERLHFAAHSHHPWPDVSRDGQLRAWDDAARLLDGKWGPILEEVLPAVQDHIARTIGLSDPRRIAFAPNTHEFLLRLFSCFEGTAPLRVLSTDGEFHSFSRQAARLEEAGRLVVERVPTEPLETFPERFASAARSMEVDLIFVSQVFFNSGYVYREVFELAREVDPKVLFVVDGYHGFMALPTDLSAVEQRVFYLSGGYKYAMVGEGACFMTCPDGYGARPMNTGWFASFGDLAGSAGEGVPYPKDGFRMFGSTFDPSGLYRFRAVFDMLRDEGLDVARMQAHVDRLQRRFLEGLAASAPAPDLSPEALVPSAETRERGRFLTFRTPRAAELCASLARAGVVTDSRRDRLRFGFGIYHDERDVDELLRRIASVASAPEEHRAV